VVFVVKLQKLLPFVIIVEGALKASFAGQHEPEPVPLLGKGGLPGQSLEGEEGVIEGHAVIQHSVDVQLGGEDGSVLLHDLVESVKVISPPVQDANLRKKYLS